MISSTTPLSEAIEIFEADDLTQDTRLDAAEHIVRILNDLARTIDLDALAEYEPDQVESLQEEIESLEAQMSDLEDQYNEQLSELRDERDDLDARGDGPEAIAYTPRSYFEAASDVYRERVAASKHARRGQKKQVQRLEDRVSELENEVASLEDHL